MPQVYFTDEEKRYAFTMERKGHGIPKIREMMQERFGRAPSIPGVMYMINTIRKRAGMPKYSQRYPEEMRRRVIGMARSGEYRTAFEILDRIALDYERVPENYTICRWIRDAGLEIDSIRNGGKVSYGDEAEALLVRLYTQGESLAQIRARLAEVIGKQPSRSWCYKRVAKYGISRTTGPKIHSIDEEESAGPLPFLVQDWEADEEKTARLIRRDGCMLAKLRARRPARREAA